VSLAADHRTIADLARVKLRLGHLNSAGEQKGVDPLIITDMMMLARNRACDDFVLLSGDADLIIGVLQAQEHGVAVHLLGITPSRGNQSPLLRREADTCQEWSSEAVGKFLRMATKEEVDARRAASPRRRDERQGKGSGAKAATSQSAPITAPSTTALETRTPSPESTRTATPTTDQKHDVITGIAGAIPEGHLRTVAAAVADELSVGERDAVLNAKRRGIIPGDTDRKLLGTAKAMLNTLLQEPEKRLLRGYLFDACRERAASSSPT